VLEATIARVIDLWRTCDLPVLLHLVHRLEVDGEHRVDTPLAVDDLEPTQVEAALRRLEEAGFIKGVTTAESSYPVVITSVTARALQAVGAWPSPEQLVDRLLAALDHAAKHANTNEERSRARRTLDALGTAGRDVLVNAAGAALGGITFGG
jgi:hypothetical protein